MFIYEYSPSDLCLAIIWIDESRPRAWFSRKGFTHARKCLLLLWLSMGSFLVLGYKSNLRSSLTMMNYEDKLETFHDLAQSGIPVAFGKGTILDKLFSTDPRPTMQRIYKNAITVPYTGGHDNWLGDK